MSQDQPIEGELEGPRGRARGPPVPEPRHRLGVPQGQHRERGEGQQGERPDDDRGAAPALGDVEPIGEDQDGGQQHDVLQHELRPHQVAADRGLEHHPVQLPGEQASEQADHAQLQRLEPGQRDRPTAPEQGDEAHEGQDDRRVLAVERRVPQAEDAAFQDEHTRQDKDVDHRQHAQPRPHDVRGLGDRASPRPAARSPASG